MPTQNPTPVPSSVDSESEADTTRLMLDGTESGARVTPQGLAAELGVLSGLANIYLNRRVNKDFKPYLPRYLREKRQERRRELVKAPRNLVVAVC
ncbi:hypothetical protein [Pelagibius sp.]|uniref:hypothetical protein n=1 Tax=Pelagibius sp. TaxID=1931238 RepID=UPI003BAE750E